MKKVLQSGPPSITSPGSLEAHCQFPAHDPSDGPLAQVSVPVRATLVRPLYELLVTGLVMLTLRGNLHRSAGSGKAASLSAFSVSWKRSNVRETPSHENSVHDSSSQ